MRKLFPIAFLALFPLAAAQDGLYDPAPPANSAFVRVLNATTGTIAGKAVTADKAAASVYVIVPQGDFDAKVGTTSGKLNVEAGNFYSIVSNGGKLVLLKDQSPDNRAKALLTVYNLSKAASVDLKTADGKTTVLTGVKPNTSASRAVNGITVDLAAFAGSKAIGTVKGVKLERGNAYALVVTDSGMTVTQSTTKTK